VALGNFGKLVNVDVQGEMLDLHIIVNSVVAQLSTLVNEVTNVSLEVRTEGILGRQAFMFASWFYFRCERTTVQLPHRC
jgi:osomolarity two-component system sensor histidine kinase NIK1